MNNNNKQNGFTLFEILLVISLAGFLFAVLSFFYVSFLKNKLINVEQLSILEDQLFTKEYISRYIHSALPSTIKVNSDSSCVEFNTIVGSGIFLAENTPSANFLKPVLITKNLDKKLQARYISIINDNTNRAESLYPLLSVTENFIGLDSPQTHFDGSAFILLTETNRFCLEQQQLRFYNNSNRNELSIEPVVNGVTSSVPFSITQSNNDSFLLNIDLNYGDDRSLNYSSYSLLVKHEY